MPLTFEQLEEQVKQRVLKAMTTEERLRGLPVEERVYGLSAEELRRALAKLEETERRQKNENKDSP